MTRRKLERGHALLRDLWALLHPRRRRIAGGFVLMVVSRIAGLVLPVSTRFFIDDVIVLRRGDMLLPLIAAVLGATAIQAMSAFAVTNILSKEAHRLVAELRRKVQLHVGRLPVFFYDGTGTGTLVTRIMHDAEGLQHLVGAGIVQFAGGLLTSVGALVLMTRISLGMTVLALLTVILFTAIFLPALRRLRPTYRESQRLYSSVSSRLYESLSGIRVVKAYHGEKREAAVFSLGLGRLLDTVLRSLTLTSLMNVAATTVFGLAAVTVMAAGAREILAGRMTVGSFFTYSMLLSFLIGPISQVVGIGTQIMEALVGLERIREVLSVTPEDVDPDRTEVLPEITGRVEFEDVYAAYGDGPMVLNGISFVAEPGSVTAIVGPSGAGKSTIMGLLAAFHAPTGGRILVDGVDLTRVRLDSYRSQLGIVLQDSFLFSGSIRENAVFGRPEATEEEMLAACRIARVDEFAEALPEGYDTIVGERGVKLSGGQRQRVAIARAILADTRILILDEATSNLDSESEALIEESLAHLMSGRTTFVIAHRLSTIHRADQILVLEQGRIVERGTHLSLHMAGGRYYEMHAMQTDRASPELVDVEFATRRIHAGKENR
jgi:ABC-type multidrug transport system fused ATPase/permease subunit